MAYNLYEIVNNGLGSNAECWQYLTNNYNSLKIVPKPSYELNLQDTKYMTDYLATKRCRI